MERSKKALLKYLFNPRCSDLGSKLAALRWSTYYLGSNLLIPSNVYAIYEPTVFSVFLGLSIYIGYDCKSFGGFM